MKNVKFYLTSVLFGLLVLTGCAQAEPQIVFVTATPGEIVGGGSVEVVSSANDVPLLQTNAPATLTPSPGPSAIFLGPIVGDGARPAVTNTPLPTATPIVPPTSADLPTAVDARTEVATQAPLTDAPPQPTRAGTPLPALDASNVGIQVISRVERDEWDVIMNQVENDLDMGWIKVQVAWDFFQPNGPDEISGEFRRLEIYLEQIHEIRDVKVLVSIAKAPNWARTDLTEDGPPTDPQALARFITLFLNEMNNTIDAVEIWNEPNLIREWQGVPKTGQNYMTYFDAGYNAVRAYSQDIVVISAGLAPTVDTPGSRNDRDFLQEMYSAGLASYTNTAIGIHPYGWGNGPDVRCCAPGPERGWDEARQFFFLDTIEDYRNIMVNNGDSDAQMWATEFGWASWEGLPGQPPDPWMDYNSKWDQANYN
ncbi:MAG: hypothetical protein AAFR22_21570, partial [Chloroflexota bacterium]